MLHSLPPGEKKKMNCFGCDNSPCICSPEEIEWRIKNEPEAYRAYLEAEENEEYYGNDE